MSETIRVRRHAIEITHPDKALFPDPVITKLDLARHYERVAAVMLPHVRGRPLALQAFPQGIDHPGCFMKPIPRHFPDWIATATMDKKGGTVTHVVAAGAGGNADRVGRAR